MTYRIVTNNRLLATQGSARCQVDMVQGDAAEVFKVVEEALQNHWKLLTSPLPPNVPLIRSPIRTLVLQSSSERYDVAGLHCLAKGQERSATLAKPHRPEQRGDLEYIDRSFAQRALQELGQELKQELGLRFEDDRAAETTALPATAEIRGVDMQDMESALRFLWKKGIHAESGMGKAGLVLRLAAERCTEAKNILYKAGYIYRLSNVAL